MKLPAERYRFERDLIDAFTSTVAQSCPWGAGPVAKEFDYRYGRTDLLFFSEAFGVIAVEAKLERWRDALQQAYRNTAFAHRSYVLLPLAAASRAIASRFEFERRKVGIVSLEDGGVRILLEAPEIKPLHHGLRSVAIGFLRSRGVGESGSRSLCSGSMQAT